MKTLTSDELDAMRGCDSPECKEFHQRIYLQQECHGFPVYASYDKLTRELVLQCTVCQQEVFRFGVK